jgi:enediyne polyketide synthase
MKHTADRASEDGIAIIGMACQFPDARSPEELWENVLAQRRAFRRIPPERLRYEDYFSPDPSSPDRSYAMEAALLEGYEFDRLRFRVAGSAFRSADVVHWLALDVASQALVDARFPEGQGLPRETTGVLLGNTLTGEFSRAALMRLRWPYVRRVVEASLGGLEPIAGRRHAFLDDLEKLYKAPFAPVGEESLAGGLSNTIAGRICNFYDLHGGGYTLDGACSSSLLAVATACSNLMAGDLDVALAGGVDLSLDPFEIVGFAKTGALAPEEMRVYDVRSAGFWPGEGCGFVVLMRHGDAVARNRRIYAVIRGWGISSDGGGGLTRPEVGGQLLALQRAYRRAGFGIDTVPFFEGHGTGTRVGDATELRVLSTARREANAACQPAVVGSVKANIGHTKAAAGLAGLLKATMAVYRQVLPPTTGCQAPHSELVGPNAVLRVPQVGEIWPSDQPLRAGVSSMGFGGINVHVVMEGAARERRTSLDSREAVLSASAQDAELICLGGGDREALLRQVEQLAGLALSLSRSDLADLAAALARANPTMPPARAALVVSTPAELAGKLDLVRSWLADGEVRRIDARAGAFLRAEDAGRAGDNAGAAPVIGFLFPGQGSPAHRGGGALKQRFPFVRDLYAMAALPQGESDSWTAIAQPAIVTASLAGLQALERAGVTASMTLGHSLGELTALQWGGALDAPALIRLAAARGAAMAGVKGPQGAMAGLVSRPEDVTPLLAGEPVVIAGHNAAEQTTISGEAAAVARVVQLAESRGIKATLLRVSHAFHSPMVTQAVPILAEHLSRTSFTPLQRTVVSTVTGEILSPEEDLRSLLCRQVTEPVLFAEALGVLSRADLLIEVGPGRTLSGLAGQDLKVPVVATDAGGPSIAGFLLAVGAAYALGTDVRLQALFADRFTRPFDLYKKRKFFVNPCELAPVPDGSSSAVPPWSASSVEPLQGEAARASDDMPAGASPSTAPQDVLELIRRLVAERVELPLSAIRDEHRLLDDLHLNSILVGQIVVDASRRLGLPRPVSPTNYADATVGQVARALVEIALSDESPSTLGMDRYPPGVDSWIRCYAMKPVERSLPRRRPWNESGDWEVFGSVGDSLADLLKERLKGEGGGGVLVCLLSAAPEDQIALLLAGARAVFRRSGSQRFVLVQQNGVGAAFARTLHLEAPGLTTCVVDLPPGDPRAGDRVLAEIGAAAGYTEAHYDPEGCRWEPRLQLLSGWEETQEDGIPLDRSDVLLVTGGGKGIAAECALGLARTTGVKLALIGRSNAENDDQLAANLQRMTDAGIRVGYYPADVTDAEQVGRAVGQAQAALGPITAILHAAGTNTPQLLRAQSEQAFLATMLPKVQGLRNILAAVDQPNLRLLVTFGSILARIGMRGEADYALANEALTRLTEDFHEDHPRCRCLALEWSLWSGVGMGERLGRVDALVREGVTPITADEGIRILLSLLRSGMPVVSVVVTGRFGDVSTLRVEQTELPLRRFLERPRVHYCGVELVADASLSVQTDPYLDDHVYRGVRIFPAVMGLEAMAQVSMSLAESPIPPVFEEVEFARPVTVPSEGSRVIRVAALMRSPGLVEIALRSEETSFQADHFRAKCRFSRTSRPASMMDWPEAEDTCPVGLDPGRDLYGGLLFQAGRFRRLRKYRFLSASRCEAELQPGTGGDWFGAYHPSDLVLGDPGARDAALHAIQACIPHQRVLPVGVERIIFGPPDSPELAVVRARERFRGDGSFTYDLEVLGPDAARKESWEGLQLRVMEQMPPEEAWIVPLLAPYLERRVEELLPGIELRVAMEEGEIGRSRRQSDRAIRRALGRRASVRHRPDGKPEVEGGPSVSAAHAGRLILAVAGGDQIGCDIEPVAPRPHQIWRDLLGTDRFELAKLVAREGAAPVDEGATRIWAVSECLKKVGASVTAPVVLSLRAPDGWVVFQSGMMRIATYIASIRGWDDRLAIAILCERSETQDRCPAIR